MVHTSRGRLIVVVGIPGSFLYHIINISSFLRLAKPNIPGHPWKKAIGFASCFSENNATKWILSPSISYVNWGNPLISFSVSLLLNYIQSDYLQITIAYMLECNLPIKLLPLLLCICKPTSWNSKSSIVLRSFVCWRRSLRQSHESLQLFNLFIWDRYGERLRLDLHA